MFSFSSYWIWAAVAIVVVYRTVFYKPLSLPPGPKSGFFNGNVRQPPVSQHHIKYAEWSRQYGPIFSFQIVGKKFVVLNNFKTASDLLEGRSNIYSDRPQSWMHSEFIGRKLTVFSISSQHPRHRIYRKMLHSGLGPRAIPAYYSLVEQEARTLVENLIKSPADFISLLRKNAGANILRVAYGWTVTGTDDHFVRLMEENFSIGAEVRRRGPWLVDRFPLLRFVPPWLPGGSFKRVAKEYQKKLYTSDQAPFDWAKKTILSGNYIPSFTSHHLLPEDGHEVDAEEEDVIKWTSNALYFGGIDSTTAAMTAFIAAMVLYPSVQERAQREIEQVIGSRAPRFEDQAEMPYVSALIKETLRWACPVPAGVHHAVTQDDTYMNYFIPKGTVIISNIWRILTDEDIYPNPMEFNPERYLGSSPQIDPRKAVFGFGRRFCPGAVFIEASMFINIVSILSSCTISKALDQATGNEITPLLDFSDGIVRHIKPFSCAIKRRTS